MLFCQRKGHEHDVTAVLLINCLELDFNGETYGLATFDAADRLKQTAISATERLAVTDILATDCLMLTAISVPDSL